jgi:hypothetical protein
VPLILLLRARRSCAVALEPTRCCCWNIYSHADAVNNIAIANNVIKHFYLEGTLLLGGRRVASPCALLRMYVYCERAQRASAVETMERDVSCR